MTPWTSRENQPSRTPPTSGLTSSDAARTLSSPGNGIRSATVANAGIKHGWQDLWPDGMVDVGRQGSPPASEQSVGEMDPKAPR